MVEYENYRVVVRDVFETRDFDAPKVDPERKPQEGDNDATNHDLRLSAKICG
jgi:hypothetical protein